MSTGDEFLGKYRNSSSPMETLARKILDLDPAVLECNISSDPDGALLANVAKPEVRGVIGPYSRSGSGMGPTWGGVAINVLRRLDSERSPLKYIMISRERYDAIICPVRVHDRSIFIGILLEKNTNATRVYEALKNALAG